MPILGLDKMTAGLPAVWSDYLCDWDRYLCRGQRSARRCAHGSARDRLELVG